MATRPGEESVPIVERAAFFVARLPIVKPQTKLRWLLDFELVVNRLCHDVARRVFEERPQATETIRFIEERIGSNDRVLDVGCASGVVAEAVSRSARSVWGIDVSAEAVSFAEEQFSRKNLRFSVKDASEISSGELGEIDVVLMLNVIRPFLDPAGLLGFLANHTKTVCIEYPDLDASQLSFFRKQMGLTTVLNPDIYRECDRDEMGEIFEACGLEVLACEFRHGMQRYWCSAQAPSAG